MTDTDMFVKDIKKRIDKLYESLQWPHWGTGDIMTMEEILKGESENLEFKVDIPTKSEKYMRTVVAFANGNGGKIVFGVEDKTLRIVGFDEDDATQKIDTITNAIWDSCEPKIRAEVYSQVIEGKNIIVADIPKGMIPPYSIKGAGIWDGTYIRVSGTTRLAPEYLIKEMTLEGMNQSFDRRKVDRILAAEEVDALCTRLYSHALNLAPEAEKEKIRRIGRSQLISWGLIAEEHGVDYATNGYQLLDGKLEQYEDASIQCAVFKGTDRANFITRKEFAGPIDEQIEEAYAFVLQHIRLGSRIEGLVRQDFYELPIKSIREMIANAVCHRSYLVPQKIQVALYDDRLEVTTPGMLGRDISIAKMELGQSLIRNKGIAAVFSYMSIIEGWGSGIPRILKEAEEYHLQHPELIDMGGSFRMNLFRRDFETDQYGVIDPKLSTNPKAKQTNTKSKLNVDSFHDPNDPVHDPNDPVHDPNDPVRDPNDPVHDPNNNKTVDQKIIIEMRNNPKITYDELAEMLSVSRATIKRKVNDLSAKGIIKRIGNNRSGYWEILIEDA